MVACRSGLSGSRGCSPNRAGHTVSDWAPEPVEKGLPVDPEDSEKSLRVTQRNSVERHCGSLGQAAHKTSRKLTGFILSNAYGFGSILTDPGSQSFLVNGVLCLSRCTI